MMMLKAFFLSQVVDSFALPQDGAGNAFRRRGLDGDRNILVRQSLTSKRRDVYQEVLTKSVWGRTAVVGAVFLFPICFYMTSTQIYSRVFDRFNYNLSLTVKAIGSAGGLLNFITVIFALRHTTGWLLWNTRFLTATTIVNIIIMIFFSIHSSFEGVREAVKKYLGYGVGLFLYVLLLYILAFSGSLSLINSLIHYVAAVCIPTYRLLSKGKGLRI